MAESNNNKDVTYFARTNFRGTDHLFGIKRKDRRQHMYVLGKSGTGKSVLMSNMIIQNIRNGEGVCVVDPHGELVEEILHSIPPERMDDVIYFNPADTDFHIGFNVLHLDDPKYKHLVASGLMGIFTKIWANAWSSRMEYILNNAILALLDTPGSTLLGIPRLLVDKDYRQVIINNLKDPVVKAFWTHEYEAWRDQFRNEAIAPIQNKVGQFLSTSIIRNVVGQSKSTIDIFNIMNSGKIFLVNVSKGRIGEDNSALLGGMIITKLQLAAMERVRIPEQDRKDFYLYVDEFQNFVTDSFASILSEARKYRLNLTIAHQYIGQLVTDAGTAVRDAVFGNVGTMIVFRIGAADADFLEKEFEPEFAPEDLVALPNYHIYLKLMVDGITSRPFSASTLPPVKIDVAAGVADTIIEASRSRYARPREEVEGEITRWSSMVPGQTDGRLDGQGQTEGKFKAECSNCKKVIYVPFEPEPGRPIYCKDCLFKIKNGEINPAAGFRPPREKQDTTSYDALSSLGIEFPGKPKPASYAQPVRPLVRPAQAASAAGVIPSKPVVPSANVSMATPKSAVAPAVNRTTPSPAASAPRPQAIPVPFKRKEPRQGPDIGGLQAALKEALSEVVDVSRKVSPQKSAALSVSPSPTPAEPTKTMSLGDLKKESEKERPAPMHQPIPKKEASEEHKSSLKDAVARAMSNGQYAPAAMKPAGEDVKQEQAKINALDAKAKEEDRIEKERLMAEKALVEKEIAAAQAKNRELEERAQKAEAEAARERQRAADEAERITKEKEVEYARRVAEEKERIEAEVKQRETERMKEARQQLEAEAEAEKKAIPDETPAAQFKTKKTKEVPEDLLKKILEE